MNILEVEGLCKTYPAFELRDVSFAVAPGTIMGFIGRNGAGKSTTIKSILNLVHPDSDHMESMQDKFMTTVRIGPKGQIVIPKEVRAMFGLEPGDSLILLADRERGIALQSSSYYDSFVRAVFDNGAKAAAPGVPEAETQVFASALERELKRGDGE